METDSKTSDAILTLKGEVSRVPSNAVVRAVLAMSGLLLLRSAVWVFVRYCFGLKGTATVSIRENTLRMDTEWSFFGKRIRRARTDAPLRSVTAVRFENRQRILSSVVGFGALTVGVLLGIQWFLDGLHAGYPYLAAAGALIIAAGVATDVFLYLFLPAGGGGSRVYFSLGPWLMGLKGVEPRDAESWMQAVQSSWTDRH